MIVGKVFHDDEDDAVKRMQHDEYRNCISLLVGDAATAYKRAQRTVEVSTPKLFLLNAGKCFDHRTVQSAHDLIAAYWRWLNRLHLPRIPGLGPTTEQLRADWHRWFRAELDALVNDAEFTRNVVRAAGYANSELGYAAEQRLEEYLRERYREMWVAPKVREDL